MQSIKNFANELLKGKIFGLPMHPILIPFPVVFNYISTGTLYIIKILKIENLVIPKTTTLLSIFFTVPAIITGTIEALNYKKNRTSVNNTVNKYVYIHIATNSLAFILSLFNYFYMSLPLSTLSSLSLVASNYFGASLAYNFGLGHKSDFNDEILPTLPPKDNLA